jgi:hypothetical protein
MKTAFPILSPLIDINTPNACICGLGELAAFLRVFAKKVTVYPSPTRCTC